MTNKEDLYTDVSHLGTTFALISAIGGTVIGVGAIAGGIYMLAAQSDLPIWAGIATLVVGILIIVGGWVYWYLTTKSKPLAAATGGAGIVNMFANAIGIGGHN